MRAELPIKIYKIHCSPTSKHIAQAKNPLQSFTTAKRELANKYGMNRAQADLPSEMNIYSNRVSIQERTTDIVVVSTNKSRLWW